MRSAVVWRGIGGLAYIYLSCLDGAEILLSHTAQSIFQVGAEF